MSEQASSSRATLTTVIASAAVTVAVGITAAALGGYIVPARDQSAPPAAPGAGEAPATLGEPRPMGPTSGVQVVLVPVAPDAPAVSSPGAEPEPMLAAYGPQEHEEHEEHHGRDRDHREDEGEDEHDDD